MRLPRCAALQQPASLYRQIIQRHLQLRNRRADFRMLSDLLLRGLESYPELHFHLEDVLWGMNSVVPSYTNQKQTHTAEFMELSAYGKVIRVVANYGG